MKKFVLPVFLLALIATPVAMRVLAKDAPATPEAAVGMKNVAVISITSYDDLLEDIAFIGEAAGQPGMDQQLEGMLQLFTQNQGLKGLDTTRPWGAAVQTDDVQFQPLIFLPVKNLNDLLGVIAPLIGAQPEDKGDGIYALQAGPQQVFVKEKSGWAYIGQTAESLSSTPADPAKLLTGLNPQYDVAVKVNVQNIPEMYRSMIVDQLKAGVEQSTAQQPEESDEAFEARKKLTDAQIQQMITSINETKEVTVGWKIDREQKATYLDFRMAAVPGSKTAAQLALLQDMPSGFSGFVSEGAAASFNFVSKVAAQDLEQQSVQLEGLKLNAIQQIDADDKIGDEDTKKVVKKIVEDLFDALVATMKSGKMDGAASVNLGEKEMSLIAGVLVAEPGKVEDSVRKLAELGKKDPKFPGIQYDAVKHNGIRFHTMSIPIPPKDDISAVVGDKLDVAIGFGSKQVYLAMGTDNIKKVTGAIDQSASGSSKSYPPARLTLSLGKILKFASVVSPNAQISAMAEQLNASAGKDHVIVALRPAGSDGTVAYRVTAEEGVLKLLGMAGAVAGGALGR